MTNNYQHQDNDYFRLGECDNCGLTTFHKPIIVQRKSGRKQTRWECEFCKIHTHVLNPVQDELKIIGAYVRKRYL